MVQFPNIVELAMCYLACARIGAVTFLVSVQYRSLVSDMPKWHRGSRKSTRNSKA